MDEQAVYLDNHATTPLDPSVLAAMMPYFTRHFGNASSNHVFGWRAEEAVHQARLEVADLLGAHPQEIIFSSGATESNNLAIKGVAHAFRERGKHIVVSAMEHPSVLDVCLALEADGFRTSLVKPNEDGIIQVGDVAAQICAETILVCVMLANNEIGSIQPVGEIAALIKERNIFFHCDAVQGFGRVAFNVGDTPVDFASLSAHKMYGPKGVGALYVRKGCETIMPLLHGGHHERGLRSGTLNVAGIVGFGKACVIAKASMHEEIPRIHQLRSQLLEQLSVLPDLFINGSLQQRLAGNLSIGFCGVSSEELLLALSGKVAASSSSACKSTSNKPSHVLKSLELSADRISETIRLGLGRFTTLDEVDYAAQQIIEAVKRLRGRSNILGISGRSL